jgi:regulator of sigma E protease
MEILQAAVGVLLFIVILGVLVLVHEIGHFVTARRAGVRVLEFGIGFPPRAKVLKSDGETLYTLNWLPIGGFVKLEGEDGDSEDERSFTRARFATKELILVAGVIMNLALAWVIFAGTALLPSPMLALAFETVQIDSPAAAAGLTANDKIVSIDGVYYDAFDGPQKMVDDLREHAGDTTAIGLLRPSGTIEEVPVTLRSPEEIGPDKGALGIQKISAEVLDLTFTRGPIEAVVVGVERTVTALSLVVGGLGQLLASIVTQPTAAPPVTGPIGIAATVTDVFWQAGPIATLYLAAILSANLALVNFLPFPPLDGGRMLVILLKRAFGERVSMRAEQLTYMVGFMFLFAFLIWITAFDIARVVGVVQ